MTPFERAMVAAFRARLRYGADSWQYDAALEDMERTRPRLPTFCFDCGGRGKHHTNCATAAREATP